jgi:hypothetical protein
VIVSSRVLRVIGRNLYGVLTPTTLVGLLGECRAETR